MSVAIISPPAKQPPSSPPADSANSTEASASGAAFASLLLGQLAIATNFSPAITERTPLLSDTNNDVAITTEQPAQDAAAMLAALGMIAPGQVAGTVDTPAPDEGSSLLLPNLPAKESATALTKTSADTFNTGLEIPADGDSSTFVLPPPLSAEEKAAKVAATDFSLPKIEIPAAGSLKDEIQAPGMASLSPHPSVTTPRNDGVLKVETPVHDHAWAGDFSQKIVWLATSDKQVAQLTLNPPQMGPIEISLTLNKDSASAFFVSQNAEVREAIESALPRLREMLASAGIELGQANVGAESFRQQAGNNETRQGAPRWMGDNAILAGDSGRSLAGQTVIAQHGKSLVDIFA